MGWQVIREEKARNMTSKLRVFESTKKSTHCIQAIISFSNEKQMQGGLWTSYYERVYFNGWLKSKHVDILVDNWNNNDATHDVEYISGFGYQNYVDMNAWLSRKKIDRLNIVESVTKLFIYANIASRYVERSGGYEFDEYIRLLSSRF